MISTTLLLVRHAHADWIPDEMRSLSEMGLRQAEAVSTRLEREKPTALYSSPYRRARQTIEPLARRLGLAIEEMTDLRERSLPTEFVEDWEAAIRLTWEDFELAFPSGGETNADALERAGRALASLRERHPGETVVVATHGNILTLLLRSLDPGRGFEFWRQISTPDLYRLTVAPGGHYRLERLSIPS